MSRIPRLMIPLVAALALVAAVACDAKPSTPATPTPTVPTATSSAAAPPTASPSASASASASRTPAATSTPVGPTSTSTPPDRYGESCAKNVPRGKQVAVAFVCIDAPKMGSHESHGFPITLLGYAGGSFESNVIVEARALSASGQPGSTVLAKQALSYAAPDVGMPGAWRLALDLPASVQPGSNVRVIAYFESPRDGSRVAQTSVDIFLH